MLPWRLGAREELIEDIYIAQYRWVLDDDDDEALAI
jgi:hypothetical protein